MKMMGKLIEITKANNKIFIRNYNIRMNENYKINISLDQWELRRNLNRVAGFNKIVGIIKSKINRRINKSIVKIQASSKEYLKEHGYNGR